VAVTARVRELIPFVHVADVNRSVVFYELLGFTVTDAYRRRDGELDWAALESASARLMLARADAPIEADRQAVLFYLYSEDLAELRQQLLAAGIAAGEIVDGTPGPKQEMGIADPDGYCLMVAQIGD
jgi:Glyoxalase/Bleomycin resistance protein/Dioxygenase superfamily